MRVFDIDKRFATTLKLSLVVFLAFVVLMMIYPFTSDAQKESSERVLILSLVSILLFGVLSAYAWKTIRKLPLASVAADEDGIWYVHKGKKQGLVSWGSISTVRERSYLQRLELLGRNGDVQIELEYQLEDFSSLRDILAVSACIQGKGVSRRCFSKGGFYHLYNIALVFGVIWLGVYVGIHNDPLIGFGGMSFLACVVLYEYAATVTSVNISSSRITFRYPLGRRVLPFSDVDDIRVVDVIQNGVRLPEVWVMQKNRKKPYRLKRLGVDAVSLFTALNNSVMR